MELHVVLEVFNRQLALLDLRLHVLSDPLRSLIQLLADVRLRLHDFGLRYRFHFVFQQSIYSSRLISKISKMLTMQFKINERLSRGRLASSRLLVGTSLPSLLLRFGVHRDGLEL